MEFTFETIGINTFLTCMTDVEKMDDFSLKMLENNEIDGLLPFSSIQENRKKKVRYAITSYETLESYMRRPLTLSKILNILESIAKTALELDEYMLYMNGIVLDAAYMYTEIKTGKTRLVYLPLKSSENVDVFEFLRNLLGRVQYEAPESAVSILKISNEINSGKITGLGQLLDAIKEVKTVCEKTGQRSEKPVRQEWKEEPKVYEAPPEFVIPKVQQEVKEQPGISKDDKKKHFGFLGSERKEKEQPKPKKKRSEMKGASPAFAIPGMEAEQILAEIPSAIENETPAAEKGVKKGFLGFKKKEKAVSGTDILRAPQIPAMELEAPVMNIKKQQPRLDFGQTIISPPDDEMTVVGGEAGCGRNGVPYILRRANGQKMYLEKDITKIGRESAYVDFYVGDNLQIGRSHAEIVRSGQDFFIKDNNSKNHTYVNRRMVTGGELALLREGDIITLASEDFEYHES